MANLLTFSPRVKNFVDAADVGGNIKNNPQILQYLNQIDNACVKAGITTGAVYPVVGGSEISHSFNFLNPSQYQISFLGGGWAHTSTGAKPNGTSSYGIISIDIGSVLSPTSITLLYASGTNNTQTNSPVEIGTLATVGTVQYALVVGQGSPNRAMSSALNSSNFLSNNINTSKGVFSTSRVGNTITNYSEQNGILSTLTANNSSPTTMRDLRIACTVDGTGTNVRFSNREAQGIVVSNGLTTDKLKIFSHGIYVAQRTLGRS